MYANLQLFIDGQWIDGDGRDGEEVINPATEKPLAHLPHASVADLDRALEAAKKGFAVWRAVSAYDRAKIMRKAADLMRERYDAISKTLVQEEGKAYPEARAEVITSADIIEWYAEEGRRAYGRIVPGRGKLRQIVIQEPVGIVAAFTPWNFPALTPARKIGGALAAGCSLILKASEETPGACVEMVRCFADAGLPAGVLNLVFGVPAKISEHLIAKDEVRKISFTGSIPVGKHLSAMAGEHMKPAIMELGGHAPVMVCDDADPEASAATSALGKSRNAGQVCIFPTRFFVQEAIYDRFTTAFGEKAKEIKVGDGLDPSSQMGPVANDRRLAAMDALIADAKAKGARVVAGGSRIGNRGYFHELTVLADVPDDARAMNEEPFGPLALLSPVKTLDEAIEKANSLPYGLAAYAFTRSARNVDQLAERVEVGNLSVNHLTASFAETPFGGVKDSGYGCEGGTEGLECYTVAKNVSHLVL